MSEMKEYRIKRLEVGFVVTQHHIFNPAYGSSAYGSSAYGTEYAFSDFESAVQFIREKFEIHDDLPEGA